jgi:2-aminoadipate transaminase
VQATYGANRDRMVAALRRDLPEASFQIPEGGYYIWLRLPEDVDGDRVTARAAEEGVIVIAGSSFLARPDAGHPRNAIRVAYSHATADEIDEGVRRLARAFREVASSSATVAAPARAR